VWFEGTGEANRAVEAARGTELGNGRPLFEPEYEAIGTGRGVPEETSLTEADMIVIVYVALERDHRCVTGAQRLISDSCVA
jgi:hypothetical protein